MVSDELTKREKEILELLVEGLTDDEISQRLKLTTYTTKSHVSHILYKLRVRNRTQAAVYYMRCKVAEASAEQDKFKKMISDALPELTALTFYQSRAIELLKALVAIYE